MKILFLDIDGVLNSVRSAVALHGYPYRERCHEKFDEVALGLIRQICDKTRAKICLSSTWRLHLNEEGLLKLSEAIDLPIVSKTPRFIGKQRGYEIENWLNEFKNISDITKYAIVDDDRDMLKEQLPFFVKTSNRNGLLYEDYEKLLELLSD